MKFRAILLTLLLLIFLCIPNLTAAQETPTPEGTLEVTAESTVEVTAEPTPPESDVAAAWRVFSPEVRVIVGWLIAIALAVGLFFAGRYGVTIARLRAWGAQYDWLVDIAYNTVARLRVTSDELTEYQQEAENTGRDVRLVAAYREIEQLAAEFGVPFNLTLTISLIERILDEQQRDAGLK